ncbi:Protein kinase domain-containing protein [Tsukamurella ocularis]|uniref:hypothetical protein n=1 Tax=Tsukamurella ocularis TaxID=1970234 RepID=UPI0039F0BB1F
MTSNAVPEQVANRIQRAALGALTRISAGGQGIVYEAPAVRTSVAQAMVYKEYKPAVIAQLDEGALADMPAFLSRLHSVHAKELIGMAAWNCAVVEDQGKIVGFVMPRIPSEFFWPMDTARGTSLRLAEVQHLLNAPSVLHQRGHVVTAEQRYALLRSVAYNLGFFHDIGVTVGDLSPKNLLFSLQPSGVRTYFIDTDAMVVHGKTALPQLETPTWEVPRGEELGTVASDSYKLGLLALRLLVGDQDVRDPTRLPTHVPPLVRQVIADAITASPYRRPPPAAWERPLSQAISLMRAHYGSTPGVSR